MGVCKCLPMQIGLQTKMCVSNRKMALVRLISCADCCFWFVWHTWWSGANLLRFHALADGGRVYRHFVKITQKGFFLL